MTPDMLEMIRSHNDEEPGSAAFTPSRLLGCARQSLLLIGADTWVDISQAWPLMRGNMAHSMMEKAQYPGALAVIREKRLFTGLTVAGQDVTFTGKPDLIVVKDIQEGKVYRDIHGERIPSVATCKVVDYKTIKAIGNDLDQAKIEHQIQVNCYAWLAERVLPAELGVDRVVVEELEIVYLSIGDLPRIFNSTVERAAQIRRRVGGKLVDDTLILARIKHWSNDAIERWIRRKIEVRLAPGLPPVLPQEDQWRCNYCPVAKRCWQLHKEELGDGEADE